MTIEGQTYSAQAPTVLEYSIEVKTEEKQLKPNQTAVLLSKFIEYKNINDINFYHFTIPTVKPEIAVRPLPDLDVAISFGGPSDAEPYQYEIRKRLDGTYFPHQNMSVRWWPKSASDESKK